MGTIMNKKNMILVLNVMIFSTTSMLPTANQQKNNDIIKYIYAADKVGELDQFADDKHIDLLEKKNEELQKEKSSYKGMLNRIAYRRLARGATYGAIGFGAIVCIKSFMSSLAAWNFELALARTIQALDLSYDKILFDEKQKERFGVLCSNIVKTIGGYMLFDTGLRVNRLIDSRSSQIERDSEIDSLIEKNQAIIAQLKEIKQTI